MDALVIVAVTLASLACVLFGTDALDRHLDARHGARHGARATPTASAGRRRRLRCHLEAAWRRSTVVHGRIAGPHGPIAVPHDRHPAVRPAAATRRLRRWPRRHP